MNEFIISDLALIIPSRRVVSSLAPKRLDKALRVVYFTEVFHV